MQKVRLLYGDWMRKDEWRGLRRTVGMPIQLPGFQWSIVRLVTMQFLPVHHLTTGCREQLIHRIHCVVPHHNHRKIPAPTAHLQAAAAVKKQLILECE